MRKATVVLVAAMILLAGCSGNGGTTASPDGTSTPAVTEDGTPTPGDGTPMDETPADGTPSETTPTDGTDGTDETDGTDGTDETDGTTGEEDTVPNATAALSDVNTSDPFKDATSMEMTLYNGSQQTTLTFENDTDAGRERYEINTQSTDRTMYSTADFAAIRNDTSGDVQYGEPDGNLASGIELSAGFLFFGGFIYTGVLEWQPPTETTIDGENVYVIESNSLNETILNNNQNYELGFDQNDVQSVNGRIVVSTDGRIQSITAKITTSDGTYGSELTLGYGPVTISQPSWVDESQAPN